MYGLINNFKRIITLSLKMTSKVTIEAVKENTEVAKRTIIELKNEVSFVTIV